MKTKHTRTNEYPETPLAASLLDWYDHNRRILPWREDPSPYHVWLSEIMLQQTRVEAVKDYYARFLDKLPSIEALAEADDDLCTKLWQGLGYYSRVRNLKRAATLIMTEYKGSIPQTSQELQKLPGIGPYTAAAMASICFGERIPAIDGNLLRVFARMTGYDKDIKANDAKKAAADYYEGIFPFERCGEFNQALMDLGAGVCLPSGTPHCDACPWQKHCRAFADGTCTTLPVTLPKAKRTIEHKTVFLIYYQGNLVLRRRPEHGLLAGLYEYPNVDGTLPEPEITPCLHEMGFSALQVHPLPKAKHIFSHKEWHMTGWEIIADEWEDFESGKPKEHELFLASAEELENTYSIPSAFAAYSSQIRRHYLEG